ncbi:MAG TPA: MarR family transcriptional regulator [Longimicrobium sp.]|jgi:MarR family 2-MHQ and catechol resistance regulon transcriptional repressor|uniref:MarR family winged helix-turn-helix transcriptional regulator n=1 Tax=Longimicrobium sp. TaxID=2029185 RepID=UPI002ED85DA9
MSDVHDAEQTERALKLWVVLSRAHAAVAAHSQADIARHGLTPAEFGVLEALHHKGPLLLGEVQKKILVTSGGVTYLVDRLAARGLVERRRCDRDRRAYYAALTPAGDALIGEIFPAHAQAMRNALAGLDEQEKDAAIRLLRTLGRHAAETDAKGGG